MACVYSIPKSPYWIGRYTDATGTRRNKSTKLTDRRKAQKLADGWESAAHKARTHELTQSQSIQVLRDLMKSVGLGEMKISSILESLRGYLASRESLGKSDSTVKRYKPVVDSFLEHLGISRSSASVASLTTAEIESWRDAELKRGKGGTTVDFGISVIRAILKAEQRKGLLSHNPAEAVECVNQGAETRECFTEQQIKDLWGVASDEWKVMILLGGDYGMRLADASSMTWEQVDLEKDTFTYLPSKTANRRKDSVVREMTPQLKEVIERLPRGVGKGVLLPSLAGKKSGSHGGLSNEFSRLMEKAGIKVPKGAKKKGAGRQFRKLGYHSLKHSAISRMAEAGIPEEQRRALLGGHSKAVHDRYTHTSKEARSAARAKMRPLI